MARVLISMSNDFLTRVASIASNEEALRVYIKRNKISNNAKAAENAKVLTELLD